MKKQIHRFKAVVEFKPEFTNLAKLVATSRAAFTIVRVTRPLPSDPPTAQITFEAENSSEAMGTLHRIVQTFLDAAPGTYTLVSLRHPITGLVDLPTGNPGNMRAVPGAKVEQSNLFAVS